MASATPTTLRRELERIIVRDASLMRLARLVRRRDLEEARRFAAPIFESWARVAYYEREFPGSVTDGSVGFEL